MLKEITVSGRLCPLGTEETPRFSWKIDSDEKNVLQKSYEIEVRSEEAVLWESGLIFSDQSVAVLYQGEALKPRTRYEVLVRVTDRDGTLHEGQTWFETGLLRKEEWKAAWISHRLKEDRPVVFSKAMVPDPARTVKKARIYATALGVYEIEINGQQVGDAFLAPGWTAYQQRLLYQTYDVTDLVRNAGSSLGVEMTVANGWYAGFLNGEGQKHFYGDRTAVLLMLAVEYEDGSTRFLGTDERWECRYSYIQSAELYMGECQDLTKQDAKGETSPVILLEEDPVPCLMAQESEPVRVIRKFPALQLIRTPREEWVIDFGQNMAGIVEVTLPKPSKENQKDEALTKIRLRHAETLDKDGNFYTENLRTARSADEYLYTAKQAGRKAHPHFTYHGFRYVLVEGIGKPDLADFTTLALSSDMKKTGHFETDHPGLDRLASNIEWGLRSNFMDIPTDCPQRDERLGWTGDAAIFAPTASFLCDTGLFFDKWLKDVALETDEQSGVPHLVPNIVGRSVGTAVWGDAATLIPWQIYESYGDKELLRKHYPLMKCWVEYIRHQAGGTILWLNGFQRGDWLALDADQSLPGIMSGGTDKHLVANCYYALSVRVLAKAAEVLDYQQDAAFYKQHLEKLIHEIQAEYITPHGRLVSETQTACALMLHFDLVPEKDRKKITAILKDNLAAHKNHLTTGFVGTASLLQALSENGLHQLAAEVALQKDYPGWLYAIDRGATTVWERWNSIRPDGEFDTSGMNSLNHYAYGSIGDWFYRKVAGIEPLEASYHRVRLQPHLTRGMSRAGARLETPYGELSLYWQTGGGRIHVTIRIPANTSAEVHLPEKNEVLELGSGLYEYDYEEKTSRKAVFNGNTTFGELLDDEEASKILFSVIPSLKDSPALGFIRSKTIQEMMIMAPEFRPVLEKLCR